MRFRSVYSGREYAGFVAFLAIAYLSEDSSLLLYVLLWDVECTSRQFLRDTLGKVLYELRHAFIHIPLDLAVKRAVDLDYKTDRAVSPAAAVRLQTRQRRLFDVQVTVSSNRWPSLFPFLTLASEKLSLKAEAISTWSKAGS